MRISLQIFCMFALLGAIVNAQGNDFTFKQSSFNVQPQVVLKSDNVPNGGVLSSSTVLLPGPISGTNTLLSTYSEGGRFAFFRQTLNVFTGEVLTSFKPIVTSMPLNDIRYTATFDGYLAFASVEMDDKNITQVFIYKMLLNGTKIKRMAATTNDDASIFYRVWNLFHDNINLMFVYSQGTMDSGKVFVPGKMLMNKLNLLDDSLGYEFPITNGDADSISCDSIPYTATAYCVFKQNSAVRGAVISTKNSFSQSPVNILVDSDTFTYSPVYCAGVANYYVVLSTAKNNNQISLIGSIVATGIGPRTINKWTISNDFVSLNIVSVIPYYDGFAIFYGITDATNNQFWYYQAFSKNFDVAVSSSLIAMVPSNYLYSSFSVASSSIGGSPSDSYVDGDYTPVNTDYGNPIGLLAIQSTPTQTIAAWYGQILKQTYNPDISLSGAYLSPLIMLVSLILGLLLL